MDVTGTSADGSAQRSQLKLDVDDALLKTVVRQRVVTPRSEVLREGFVPEIAHILLDGHTYRYRMLSDGRRQITAVLVPGDICDLEAVMRGRADYGVGTLSKCVLGEIPAERLTDHAGMGPELMKALWRRLLRDEAIAREWLVGLGKRTALERMAHLFCEMSARLKAVGLADGDSFDFHITQSELADVLGMSEVHTNRTIQELRRTGLIEMTRGTVTILDQPTIELIAGFDPIYLKTA